MPPSHRDRQREKRVTLRRDAKGRSTPLDDVSCRRLGRLGEVSFVTILEKNNLTPSIECRVTSIGHNDYMG